MQTPKNLLGGVSAERFFSKMGHEDIEPVPPGAWMGEWDSKDPGGSKKEKPLPNVSSS